MGILDIARTFEHNPTVLAAERIKGGECSTPTNLQFADYLQHGNRPRKHLEKSLGAKQ
jgi:hypothetical protein